MSTNLCKLCIDPGHCCRAFSTGRLFPIGMTREQVKEHYANGTDPWERWTTEKMPFIPLRTNIYYTSNGKHKPETVTWWVTCPLLDCQGLCSDYENRPKICRVYEPGCDPMCAMFSGEWGGRMRLYREEKRSDSS
jgi:Fe-S-cluster containining protein